MYHWGFGIDHSELRKVRPMCGQSEKVSLNALASSAAKRRKLEIEIEQGLYDGDGVVVSPPANLANGRRVSGVSAGVKR